MYHTEPTVSTVRWP